MNRTIASINDAPAAFGTHFAHRGTRVRHLLTGTECMGRAVETIWCCYRPDCNWFEQNIVARIASHLVRNILVILLEAVCDFVPWRFRADENVIPLRSWRIAVDRTHAQIEFVGNIR